MIAVSKEHATYDTQVIDEDRTRTFDGDGDYFMTEKRRMSIEEALYEARTGKVTRIHHSKNRN
jgi:hypothetical protein